MNTNFLTQEELRQKAVKVLVKAKEIEKRKLEQGWRWVRIGKLSKILVPCDKNGKPTLDGQKQIDNVRNTINIIL